MKKSTLLLALLFIAAGAFSQDLTSKKGETILPEAGEYSIGFDASPFLNYVGNFLGSGSNTSPSAEFTNSYMAITGKQFITATTANRAMVRIGLNNVTDKEDVPDLGGTDPDATVEDVTKTGSTDVVLGAGREFRRGNTRVQGVYGGQAMLMLNSTKTTYEPGNALNDVLPGTFTEMKSGMGIGFGLGAFVGAEIFVWPKISIAMEYGWGLSLNTSPKGEVTVVTVDANGDNIEETIDGTTSSSNFSIDTNNWSGDLHINFHF